MVGSPRSDHRGDGPAGHDGQQGRRGDSVQAAGQLGVLRVLAPGGAPRERGGTQRGLPQVGVGVGV